MAKPTHEDRLTKIEDVIKHWLGIDLSNIPAENVRAPDEPRANTEREAEAQEAAQAQAAKAAADEGATAELAPADDNKDATAS